MFFFLFIRTLIRYQLTAQPKIIVEPAKSGQIIAASNPRRQPDPLSTTRCLFQKNFCSRIFLFLFPLFFFMNNANITFGFFHTRKNEYLARGYVFGRGLTTAGDLRNENGEESEQSWVRCFPGSGHMEGTAMIEHRQDIAVFDRIFATFCMASKPCLSLLGTAMLKDNRFFAVFSGL
ncbi:hypothetical protein HDV63DRAFT_308345 [Trichoderma sp. SZMC 28014]